jgi:hypothetical protein
MPTTTVYVLTEGNDVQGVTTSDEIRERWGDQGATYGNDAYFLDDPELEFPGEEV